MLKTVKRGCNPKHINSGLRTDGEGKRKILTNLDIPMNCSICKKKIYLPGQPTFPCPSSNSYTFHGINFFPSYMLF